MKISAYVLAADPAFLQQSVRSYYDFVDEIIVSYDETYTSWTGTPIPVGYCLQLLADIDYLSKMTYRPGSYFRAGYHPLDNETFQRQRSLEDTRRDADWVLQLDTDEVLANPNSFIEVLQIADGRGFGAVDYPARNLYQHIYGARFLENCRRMWRVSASYPGAVAVRPGTKLTHCRQADTTPTFRADFSCVSTDPARARDAPVHKVISEHNAIMHYSWIRDPAYMHQKAKWSGHAKDRDWDRELKHWEWSKRHPNLATVLSPVRELTYKRGQPWLRVSTVR